VILVGTVDPVPWDRNRLTDALLRGRGPPTCAASGSGIPLAVFSASSSTEKTGPDARERGGLTFRRPAVARVPLAACRLRRHETSINDAGVQALQTKFLPAITGSTKARDFDARARYLLGLDGSIGRSDPAITLMDTERPGDPQDPKSSRVSRISIARKGWTAKATDAYAKALALWARYRAAAQRAGRARRAQGDDAGAEKALRTPSPTFPEDSDLARRPPAF